MKKIYFFLIAFYSIQMYSQISVNRDNSFGNSGVFTSDVSSNQKILSSKILILPDHSIINMIYGEQSNSVLKLKPNGMLDPNFGNNGKLDFVENNFMNAVLQGDKIIINFGPNASNFSNPYEGSKIIRITQDGTLDPSFGENGVVNEITESINPQSLSVMVLPDLSLIVSNSNSTHSKKFTKDGQLETSFGDNGEIVYDYHFPIGQFSNGKIATCDISSLSSSVYSFFDLYSLTTNTVLNLTNASCHELNGSILQNKTNISTRTTKNGMVYSIFEYKNYPIPDFSRMVLINDEKMDLTFNGKGFLTSEDSERFLDAGFGQNLFFILNEKGNQKYLSGYAEKGNSLLINNQSTFSLLSGNALEIKDNYILVNSIVPNENQIMSKIKIEKFIFSNDLLSTINNSVNKIEVENPVKDFLNIRNAENAINFEVLNMEGRKILEAKNLKNMKISSVTKGNYLLKITLKNGEIVTKKLIKN